MGTELLPCRHLPLKPRELAADEVGELGDLRLDLIESADGEAAGQAPRVLRLRGHLSLDRPGCVRGSAE